MTLHRQIPKDYAEPYRIEGGKSPASRRDGSLAFILLAVFIAAYFIGQFAR